MIIHLGTRVESVFGRLDENGNVIEQVPVGVSTSFLTQEAFDAIREHLVSEKAKLEVEPEQSAPEGETDAHTLVCS